MVCLSDLTQQDTNCGGWRWPEVYIWILACRILATYLFNYLVPLKKSRLLRSSSTNMLTVQRDRTRWGSRAFAAAAPSTWNSLPVNLRTASTVTLFKNKRTEVLYHPRNKLGWTFCGHKYSKNRLAILNFGKITCTFDCTMWFISDFNFSVFAPTKKWSLSMAAILNFTKTLKKSLAHLHNVGNVIV